METNLESVKSEESVTYKETEKIKTKENNNKTKNTEERESDKTHNK